MKTNICIIMISFLITVVTFMAGVFSDLRIMLIALVSMVCFLGYLLAFVKEYTQSKREEREYHVQVFPRKYLLIANTIVLIACLAVMLIIGGDNSMATSLLIGVFIAFVIPMILGIYIVIFGVSFWIKHKNN